MRNAVAYYRVSTERQGQSRLGLEAQIQSVRQYIHTNQIHLVKEMTEVESGKKNSRPILKVALDYCKKNKALLVIAKLDRLGRSVSFISTLMESDVQFIAVDNPHANELVLHIMAAIAQHERKAISIRTKEALQAAKKRGTILGIHGINVLSKKNKEDARHFANKMNPIIENLQKQGFKTVRQITEELNRLKIPTFRKKGHKWHLASVHSIMSYRSIE
jgi:DNA invertase Pin-like site-specific DNA recombinase